MSTSLTRDTHFRGSRVPKTPQSQPKTLQRSFKNRIDFCIDFWTVFLWIWGPFWDPRVARLGSKNALNSFTWLHLASPGTPNSDSLTTYWPEFLLRPDLCSVRSPFGIPWPSLGHQIPIFDAPKAKTVPKLLQ